MGNIGRAKDRGPPDSQSKNLGNILQVTTENFFL